MKSFKEFTIIVVSPINDNISVKHSGNGIGIDRERRQN